MGSDFQILTNAFFTKNRMPPVEEAYWLIGLPENFQSRTVDE
jgi:hypothetical protein